MTRDEDLDEGLHVRFAANLEEDQVRETIRVARKVARWNRNRTWDNRITCVTDDRNEVAKHMNVSPPVVDRAVERAVGSTFRCDEGHVIWVSPGHTSWSEAVVTLNHEVAHALTVGAHGWTWRRMHLMLLPLTYGVFDVKIPDDFAWWSLAMARDIVVQYRREPHYRINGRAYGLTPQARVEITKHVAAMERCGVKFGGEKRMKGE